MKFRETEKWTKQLERPATMWVPKRLPLRLEPRGETTTIQLGRERRVVQSHTLGLANRFNADLNRRRELGHDCRVFALACAVDDPLEGVVFEDGSIYYDYALENLRQSEPEVVPGRSVSLIRDLGAAGLENAHVAVRASVDEGTALYLSKIGPAGDVALGTFDQMTHLYQTAYAVAGDICYIPHP